MGEQSFDPVGLDGYDTGASNEFSCESTSTQNFVTVKCTYIDLYNYNNTSIYNIAYLSIIYLQQCA